MMLQSNCNDMDICVLVRFAGDYQAALATKVDHPNGIMRLWILLLIWCAFCLYSHLPVLWTRKPYFDFSCILQFVPNLEGL